MKRKHSEPDAKQPSLNAFFSPSKKSNEVASETNKKPKVITNDSPKKSASDKEKSSRAKKTADKPKTPRKAAPNSKSKKKKDSASSSSLSSASDSDSEYVKKKSKSKSSKKKSKASASSDDDSSSSHEKKKSTKKASPKSSAKAQKASVIADDDESGTERMDVESLLKSKPKTTNSKETIHARLTSIQPNEKRHRLFQQKMNGLDERAERKALEEADPNRADHVYQRKGPGVKYTPMEQQFIEIKQKNPKILLMMEHGYRYRFFGEDAETASKVLKIQSHWMKNFLNASIPIHRVHIHTRKLVAAGHKVGIISQTETAAIKAAGSNKSGPFTRKLTQIYTRATLIGQNIDPLLHNDSAMAVTTPGKSSGPRGKPGDDEDEPEDEDLEEELVETAAFGNIPDFAYMGNYIMCLYESVKEESATSSNNACLPSASGESVTIYMVATQTSTGEILYDSFQDGFMRHELETRLAHIKPVELVIPENLTTQTEKVLRNFNPHDNSEGKVTIERKGPKVFSQHFAHKALAGALSSSDTIDVDKIKEENEELDEEEQRIVNESKESAYQLITSLDDLLQVCFGVLLNHLAQFSLESLFFLDCNYVPFTSHVFMELDSNALRNLEVFENDANNLGKGTLFWVLNHTLTAMGRRALIDWIHRPIMDVGEINKRLDAVSELMGESALDELFGFIKGMHDLERGICRIYYKKCTINEFVMTITTFDKLRQLLPAPKRLSSALLREIVTSFPNVETTLKSLFNALNEDDVDAIVRANGKEENVPEMDRMKSLLKTEGFPALAECKANIDEIEEKIEDELQRITKELGLKKGSLSYKKVGKDEYLVEVPKTQKVPNEWLPPFNSTKMAIRFRTPELEDLLKDLQLARENLNVQLKATWSGFLAKFASKYELFRRFVKNISTLDVLRSLSVASQADGYTRPELVPTTEPHQIKITGGRHPIVEKLISDSYVPNSIEMKENFSAEERQEIEQGGDSLACPKSIILTGPNMGGKTSLARQIALICLMSQLGCYVPAESVVLTPLDGIYTRMGAQDDLFAAQSTFFVEMLETSRVMARASSRSLVILDELGRGTSTHDGVAIAHACLQYIVESLRCFTLFITHYPGIVRLVDKFPLALDSYHMAFKPAEGTRITFLYQLVRGTEGKSYGLNVAQLANIDPSIIETATVFSRLFERELLERQRAFLARNLHGMCLDFLAFAGQCLARAQIKREDEMDVENPDDMVTMRMKLRALQTDIKIAMTPFSNKSNNQLVLPSVSINSNH